MTRLPALEATPVPEAPPKVASSGVRCDLCPGAINGFDENPPGVGGIAPLADAHPLVDLQVLIVGEEVLDLLKDDRRQVLPLADIGVIWEGRVDRNTDQLLVAAMLVLEIEDADRPRPDDRAGDERRAGDDQSVERIAIGRERVGD